jgi:6-phosphofructokinase 2
MDQAPILTLTLNPALDITTTTQRLTPRRKLRCLAPRYDAGGGGANVSRAIKELGGTSLAFLLLGGRTGERYMEVLAPGGIDTRVYQAAGETRFSLTVMEEASGEHYRFLLPGPEQPREVVEPLLQEIVASVEPRGGYVVASGTLPPGLPVDFYARVIGEVRKRGARVILDTSQPALSAALRARPYCVRINHLEAQELVGGEAVPAAEALARRLVAEGTAELAIITAGDEGAFVATAQSVVKVAPPRVKVKSTVGAGDSFVAALTLGLARGWPIEKAARYGVAAAASAVSTDATELCKRTDTDRYYAELAGVAA